MITEAVQEICEKHGYCGGIEVCIRVPEGAQTAQKILNPRLGISGQYLNPWNQRHRGTYE